TVIARLDIRREQVLVEAIIDVVQDGHGLNLGVQWANNNVGAQQFTNTGLPVFNAAYGQRPANVRHNVRRLLEPSPKPRFSR
ncbi:hypothetical protein O5853_31250, partial [Escherichia coli]|nr:hypothetical protein [Escherichia coli]